MWRGAGPHVRKLAGAALRDIVAAAVTSGALKSLISGGLASQKRELKLGIEMGLRRIALWATAVIFAAIAVAFLIAALYQWLSSLWGGALAALAVGGVLLLVAGLLVVLEKTWPNPKEQPEPVPPPPPPGEHGFEHLLHQAKAIAATVGKQEWVMLIIAFVAGLLMSGDKDGRQPPEKDRDPEKDRNKED